MSDNMAGSLSMGQLVAGETDRGTTHAGAKGSVQPTTTPLGHGLLTSLLPDSDRRSKRQATSPIETWDKLTKAFKSAFSPKLKTPEHSNVYIDGDGMTHVMKPGERIPLRNLAQQVSSPLPKFDPEYEVMEPPQPKSPLVVDPSAPLTLASIQQSNRALLTEFCNTVTDRFNRELKMRDDYINHIAAKLNACASTLVAILERLSEYEHRLADVEKEMGTQDTSGQRSKRMLRDVVLLVDCLKLEDKETREHRVVTLLNEIFEHPHGRDFMPMDLSCAYSVGKTKPDGTKTVKVVFQSAWLRRYVFNQRYKLKATN